MGAAALEWVLHLMGARWPLRLLCAMLRPRLLGVAARGWLSPRMAVEVCAALAVSAGGSAGAAPVHRRRGGNHGCLPVD